MPSTRASHLLDLWTSTTPPPLHAHTYSSHHASSQKSLAVSQHLSTRGSFSRTRDPPPPPPLLRLRAPDGDPASKEPLGERGQERSATPTRPCSQPSRPLGLQCPKGSRVAFPELIGVHAFPAPVCVWGGRVSGDPAGLLIRGKESGLQPGAPHAPIAEKGCLKPPRPQLNRRHYKLESQFGVVSKSGGL